MKQLKKIEDLKIGGKINTKTGKLEYDIKHVAEILENSSCDEENEDFNDGLKNLNKKRVH